MHFHFPSCYAPSALHPAFNQPCSLLLMICRDVYWSPSVITLSEFSWKQASLPITSGCIGIRSAVLLAPSAYLASAAGCASMSLTILPERLPLTSPSPLPWKLAASVPVESPTGEKACQQKCWDSPLVDVCFTSLLSSTSPQGRVRLLASQQKEAGAWLSAPPVSALAWTSHVR